MTTYKRPGMSRRQVLTTAAVGVPAMGVLAATNVLGAAPAKAAPLATDGWWGFDTTMALQRHFGLSQTGWVDSQPASQADSNPALAGGWDWQPDGSAGGSTTISALQKMVGAGVDGLIGPATISALQARYGVAQDGVLDGPSLTIQKLQAELNAVSGYGELPAPSPGSVLLPVGVWKDHDTCSRSTPPFRACGGEGAGSQVVDVMQY